jgi:hypothetical protein
LFLWGFELQNVKPYLVTIPTTPFHFLFIDSTIFWAHSRNTLSWTITVYVLPSLCATITMCYHHYVLPSLCVTITVCYHHYVLPSLCVTITMCYHHYVLPSLCFTITMFYHHCVLPSLCVTITMCYQIPRFVACINPLNAELNPICHLLALLGAHHIFHVSRRRFKDWSLQRQRKCLLIKMWFRRCKTYTAFSKLKVISI